MTCFLNPSFHPPYSILPLLHFISFMYFILFISFVACQVKQGGRTLHCASHARCQPGMTVRIGPSQQDKGYDPSHQDKGYGLSHQDKGYETRQIAALGSLILDSPLNNAYPAGTTVVVYESTVRGVDNGQGPGLGPGLGLGTAPGLGLAASTGYTLGGLTLPSFTGTHQPLSISTLLTNTLTTTLSCL